MDLMERPRLVFGGGLENELGGDTSEEVSGELVDLYGDISPVLGSELVLRGSAISRVRIGAGGGHVDMGDVFITFKCFESGQNSVNTDVGVGI